jgi:heterodisulfide reductase subunit E
MYMYYEAQWSLYVLTVITMVIFLIGVYTNIYLMRKGKAKSLMFKLNLGAMLKALFVNVIFQSKLLKQSSLRWFMHISIFWGFMGLLAHTTFLAYFAYFVSSDSASAKFFFTPHSAGRLFLDFWGDFWGTLLLVGCSIAIYRRYVSKAQQLDTILADTVAIWLLFSTAATGFFCEAVRFVPLPLSPEYNYSFLGYGLSKILKAVVPPDPLKALKYTEQVRTHIIIGLFLILYIPFSKMWHIFVSPIEILLDESEEHARRMAYERYCQQ